MAANIPYGNAFLVNTPSLDQLEQRLYAEERQRQAQNQYNIKLLDDEYSKNVANIRDADVDDLTNTYKDYKLSAQALMKKKGEVSPKEQMDVLRKKAAMYKLINESKAEREREEIYGKRYAVKPDDFNDNAAELLIKGRQLPLSQKKTYKTVGSDGKEIAIDLTNPENLLWQDKTNWQPILQKAGGTLLQRGSPVIVDLPGGLEQEVTTYKGGNDPVEFYRGIMGAMTKPRDSQSLANRYPFTPEEAQDIITKFEELKKTPAFKNAYGDVKFPESAGLSTGSKTAMLLAMTNAINNPPVESKRNQNNVAAITANRQAFQANQQAIREANKNYRAQFRQNNPGLGDYDLLGDNASNIELVQSTEGLPWDQTVKTISFVPVNKIDSRHNAIISANGDTRPVTINGRQGYVVDVNGNWTGQNGKIIDRYAVAESYRKAYPKIEKKPAIQKTQSKPSGSGKVKVTW